MQKLAAALWPPIHNAWIPKFEDRCMQWWCEL